MCSTHGIPFVCVQRELPRMKHILEILNINLPPPPTTTTTTQSIINTQDLLQELSELEKVPLKADKKSKTLGSQRKSKRTRNTKNPI